jgi:hypothetical protein
MKSRKVIVVYALIIAVLLFATALYYYKNQNGVSRNGLVGDAICGNLLVQESQDSCCAEVHKNTVTPACVGGWKYMVEEKVCEFVCGVVDSQEPIYRNYCETEDDCAVEVCCHPDSVVNKYYEPNCEAVLCTAVCEGPLDCGEGKIECVDNTCVIVSN